MKHFFELPGDYGDRLVTIEYSTHAIITAHFESKYNGLCMKKMTAEQDLEEKLQALVDEQRKPQDQQDPAVINMLAFDHKMAVDNYEHVIHQLHDMENTLVPVQVVDHHTRITISNQGNGQAGVVQLTTQDLQTIIDQYYQLKKTVAADHKRTFHETPSCSRSKTVS